MNLTISWINSTQINPPKTRWFLALHESSVSLCKWSEDDWWFFDISKEQLIKIEKPKKWAYLPKEENRSGVFMPTLGIFDRDSMAANPANSRFGD